jgi:hypothetical protein
MFEPSKKYQFLYQGTTQELVFTGFVLDEHKEFVKIVTERDEKIILRLDRITSAKEVKQ